MSLFPGDWIIPDWPAPSAVRAAVSGRQGGVSQGAYASLNLGDHVGDAPEAVAENRQRLRTWLPAEPRWLRQIHGVTVVDAEVVRHPPEADGSVTRLPGVVCAVLVADCLPVLLCDDAGSVVGVAHGGWRGLAAGVLEQTLDRMAVAPASLMAYLGPAIGPEHFQVGDEVRSAFLEGHPEAASAFCAQIPGKWLGNLYELARQRLIAAGVRRIHGGSRCTFAEADRFYSYRREGATGRMAALIWLESAAGE